VTPYNADELGGPTAATNSLVRADVAPNAPTAFAGSYGYKNAMVYISWLLAPSTGSPVESLLVTLYDATGAIVQQETLDSSATSWSFPWLPNDTAFTTSVVATNAAGSSVESNRATATTLGLIPPAFTPEELAPYGNLFNLTVTLSGTELVAHLEGLPAGTWLFGYAYSTPVALGWSQVDAGGFARWSIASAALAPGSHTLVVQGSFGEPIGSAAFAVPAPAVAASLAHTGSDPAGWVALALALLALGGLTARRKARA